MNRRRFMELTGLAVAGTGIVYSFPSVIVPRNVMRPPIGLSGLINQGYTLVGIEGNWLLYYERQLVEAKAWMDTNWNGQPWR